MIAKLINANVFIWYIFTDCMTLNLTKIFINLDAKIRERTLFP